MITHRTTDPLICRIWIEKCRSSFAVFTALSALSVFIQSAVYGDERPNILLCVADDASQPHFGAYGCQWVSTPAFDRIAREGILFTNAYVPNAKCAPSRACILTGRNSWQLKGACNQGTDFPQEIQSYVEVLAANGYFVGKTAKGWAPGKAVDAQGDPRQLAGVPFDEKKNATPPTSEIFNGDYAGNFQEFLKKKPKNYPFCFWYGSKEPHRRYENGSGVAKGGKRLRDIRHVPAYWPDTKEVRNDMLDYAFEIEYFDRHLGRMLEILEQRGELENTLIVVISDNGMPFPRVKGQEYEHSNHIPMAIMWKRGIQKTGRVVKDYVSTIDIAPTFLEVTSTPSAKSGMSGKSLTDILFSEKSGQVCSQRDHVLIGKERHDMGRPGEVGYPIRGIVQNGFLYLHNFETSRWPAGNPECGYPNCDRSPTKTQVLAFRRSGKNTIFWQQAFGKRPTEELYDVVRDPDCVTNLAANDQLTKKKELLKKKLFDTLKIQNDPRMLGQGMYFEKMPYSHNYWKDFYLRRFVKGEDIPMSWVAPTDYDPELRESQ